MFNFITKIFLFVSLLLTFNQVIAKPVSGLYDVDLLVKNESADVRWAALKQGMDEVFVRIAGDSVIMDKLKRPAASTYVKQYRYEPVPVSTTVAPATNKAGALLTHHIKIQYNGSAMEKYLLDNGFPVWGKHRPDVVVWLAVRDGTNEYVLKDADQSLLKTSADEALIRRGIPVHWPLYDYKDRKKLSVADIRGGFNDQVMNASKRYSRGPALTGSIIWNGKQWQSSWNLLMESGNRHWSLVDANYSQLIKKAIDQAADALGVVFAVNSKMNKQQLATIRLDIQAVDSVKKYLRVEDYLTNLSAVETVAPLKVGGQNAVFEVRLRSNEEDLLNLIKNSAELIKVEAPLTPENKPAVDIQPPVIDSGNGSEKDIEVISSDEIVTENNDDASLAENPQDQLPVYYYRLNR